MSLSSSLQWRWKGLRRELTIARHTRGAARFAVLVRLGRRPHTNARWRLQRFGQATLASVLAAAEARDVPVFVTFGTLLGWVRDQGFIAHDDDIDLGLLDEHWPRVRSLAAALEGSGWEVTWFGDDEVRFRRAALGGVAVDVFRFRRTHDGLESRAFSQDEEHVYRFDPSLLGSFEEIEAFGLRVRAPRDPEAFLAAHYGDWHVPKEVWDYRTDAFSAT